MNRICLVGRIVRDLELKRTAQGMAVCNFSIAVKKVFSKDPNNNADFFDCVIWGAQAENLTRYQKKGDQVGVEGRLETRAYTDRDGNNRRAYEIIADRITFLGVAGGSDNPRSYEQQHQQSIPNLDEEDEIDTTATSTDDGPF